MLAGTACSLPVSSATFIQEAPRRWLTFITSIIYLFHPTSNPTYKTTVLLRVETAGFQVTEKSHPVRRLASQISADIDYSFLDYMEA